MGSLSWTSPGLSVVGGVVAGGYGAVKGRSRQSV